MPCLMCHLRVCKLLHLLVEFMNKTMLLLVNIETKGCKVLLPPKISLVH